ncbi:uncharacterized protein LOC132048727 [Lycium ferocissimum]|uniref:uncharacterized protein LOC132048727 n=1 Tax=Lycium ferocissimum TaxID=112874 RepID=UPI0028164053|nr:uncharacterized protein LOC132048727 [Lycium ferocissimum]
MNREKYDTLQAYSEEEPGFSNHSEKVNSEGNKINSDDDVVLRTIYRQRSGGAKSMKKGESRRKHLADRKPASKQRKRPPTTRQKSQARLDSALLVNKEKTTSKRWRRVHLANLSKLRDEDQEVIVVSNGEEEDEEATLVRKNSKSRRTSVVVEKKTVAEGSGESEKEEAVAEGKKASKSPKKRKNGVSKEGGSSKRRRVSIEGPGSSKKRKQELEEERQHNLQGQKVLLGRVIDPEIVGHKALEKLMEVLKSKKWEHLMEGPVVAYEKEVADFFINLRYTSDYSLVYQVGAVEFTLDEEQLGTILGVPIDGVSRLEEGDKATADFKLHIVKRGEQVTTETICKKQMKSQYQLLFEFVNKVMLPRTEKRCIASKMDLVLMEILDGGHLISLPGIMLQHMIKVVDVKDGKHSLPYGFFLTKVFEHFKVSTSKASKRTKKQMFSMSILEECECVPKKGGAGNTYTISGLNEANEKILADVENTLLKAEITRMKLEGPGPSGDTTKEFSEL